MGDTDSLADHDHDALNLMRRSVFRRNTAPRSRMAVKMRIPVSRSEQSITRQEALEARVQALEAIVGALLRISAGKQDLASALKEARLRGEASMQDPANNASPDCLDFYRDAFHELAVSMIPLQELETFRASLQNKTTPVDSVGEEGSRGSVSY
jgi:type II secretory pathway component PulJ